jgi:hypothetical protein
MLEPGQMLPVSRLFASPIETICLRGPYERIHGTGREVPSRQSEFLDEGSWGLALESADGQDIRVYRRSSNLDVMLAHELDNRSPIDPEKLDLKPCVSRQNGVVVRFERNGRRYITLAEPNRQ